MTKQNLNSNILILIGFVLVTATLRILNVTTFNDTQFAQFSPLMASCLFIGAYFKNNVQALVVTFLAMFVSDLLIQNIFYKGQYGFMYSGWLLNYALYIGITILGIVMLKKVNIQNVLVSGVIAVLGFFLISNFMYWMGNGTDARTNFLTPLAKNWEGLRQSYYQAIPFLRNNMVATLVYSGVFFGAYELMKVKMPSLAKAK